MLTDPSYNPVASTVEIEAEFLLFTSLLAYLPKEELEDQVFDILSLWIPFFACEESSGMMSLLGVVEQCLKTGKKQPRNDANVTRGLIVRFKAL